jgi:hypothetical protein
VFPDEDVRHSIAAFYLIRAEGGERPTLTNPTSPVKDLLSWGLILLQRSEKGVFCPAHTKSETTRNNEEKGGGFVRREEETLKVYHQTFRVYS